METNRDEFQNPRAIAPTVTKSAYDRYNEGSLASSFGAGPGRVFEGARGGNRTSSVALGGSVFVLEFGPGITLEGSGGLGSDVEIVLMGARLRVKASSLPRGSL